MLMRRVSPKDKIPIGLRRTAGIAVVTGVAAASVGGIGTAQATCIGLSGINIGIGCDSSFGNFALGLGPDTVAVAREGFINGAIAIGTNVGAFAGHPDGISVANVALNLGSAEVPFSLNPDTGAVVVPDGAYNGVLAGPGFLNLGANLTGAANAGGGTGPTPMEIRASGIASSVINAIGANRNSLTSQGVLANITVLGTVFAGPNGSDNTVTSTGPVSVAFVRQGIFSEPLDLCDPDCGNEVHVTGPFALGGAFNTVKRTVTAGTGNRISIAFPFNDNGTTPVNVFATGNGFAPTTVANGNDNRPGSQLRGSLTKASKQFSSSLHRISKRLSDGVQNALGGLGNKKQNSESETES